MEGLNHAHIEGQPAIYMMPSSFNMILYFKIREEEKTLLTYLYQGDNESSSHCLYSHTNHFTGT